MIIELLKAQAEAKKARALHTLRLYEKHPVAVGEHSTDDLYEDIEKAYTMYIEACDELEYLETLKKEL